MGKTSKPLTLVVHTSLRAKLESQLALLQAQGHRVVYLTDEVDGEYVANADLVLAPNAWRMLPELTKYLDAAIKGARVTAYPLKPKG